MFFVELLVEWLKTIFPTAIFVGLSSWAIFYFAGKFWGFLWLGFWAFLLVLVAFGWWRGWWGHKIVYDSDRFGCGGKDKKDISKFKPKP